MRRSHYSLPCGLLLWVTMGVGLGAEDPSDSEVFFESKVRPLLIAKCYECHSRDAQEEGGALRVDTANALRKGGSRGPAFKSGDVKGSLLLRAIRFEDDEIQMPPDGKMSAAEISILEKWIASGAYDPREDHAPTAEHVERDWRQHWAFQLPKSATVPETIDPRCVDRIDAVAIFEAQKAGIHSAEAADRATLIRRLYFDLIGLPPSYEEVTQFVESNRIDSVTRLIDQLLARPEFGERWGRYWLDLARYADTVGYTLAGKLPRLEGSEGYRDWVIRTHNSDMPFDRQLLLQLAADRFDPKNENGDLDAMGFLTIGRRFLSGDDTIDDRIDVVTRGLLGMTVACARCHDHKFDPIPTMDYYGLYGVMASSELRDDSASKLAMHDRAKPRDFPVLLRGQRGNRGPIAPRRFLTALHGEDAARFTSGSGRIDLANAIVDTENPLTYRVFVNRVWLNLTGAAFVDTPSDFGVRTQRPKQSAVLDELAAEFARTKSLKQLVRRIVSSHLYQQSSRAAPADIERDPQNQFFARASRRRRDFESLRDSILHVVDHLDRRHGGEPVKITEDQQSARRSVYAFIDRQQLPSVFRVFDVASPDAHSPQRYYTTVPQQALFLLNSPFVQDMSAKVVRKTVPKRGAGPASGEIVSRHVMRVFQRILGRAPSAEEVRLGVQFCARGGGEAPRVVTPAATWRYGFGEVNESQTQVDSFREFPHCVESRWLNGEKLPDNEFGWVSLTATGGHPDRLAAIRRWVSPGAGRVEVSGEMEHLSAKGDGVTMIVASAGVQLVCEDLHDRSHRFAKVCLDVTQGQAIDFITHRRGNTSFDSFLWKANIRLERGAGYLPTEFNSERDFCEAPDRMGPRMLSRLEQYAQALIASNEFVFVD